MSHCELDITAPPRPLPVINGRQMTEADVRRLYSRIEPQHGGKCRENGWSINNLSGHKQFAVNGKKMWIHRLIYLLEVGDIPVNMHVHHRCHNPGCCNSAHLELLSKGEHSRLHDGGGAAAMMRARTHCLRCGHELVQRTSTTKKRGFQRYCPACSRHNWRAYYYRRRQQLLVDRS